MRRSASVVSQHVHDELVLVHLDTNQIFTLTSTATRLWQLLERHDRVAALVDTLLEEYEVDPERLRRDVHRTLALLARHRLVHMDSRR